MNQFLTKKLVIATMTGSLMLLANTATHAKIYKWTDAKGVVHYTANKPTQKKIKAENIEVKIRSAAGKYTPTNKSTPSKTETKSTASSEDGETKMSGPTPGLISYCKTQRSNLMGLKKNFRNVWKGLDGKKKKLNQEERRLKIELIQKQISEDCSEVK